MRTRLIPSVRAWITLGLLALASPSFGLAGKLEPFDQAIHDVYLDIIQTGQSVRHKPPEAAGPRIKDIVKTSERVFAASPQAAGELKHLRRFVASRIAEDASDPKQAAPARDLLSSDDPGLASLVGISVFWNEAQRRYDRSLDYRSGIAHMSAELPVPIEMEQRGWQAGCRFWKAGIGVLFKPTDNAWPKSYFCEDKFPAVYYCRQYFAVEIVVMTGEQLKTSGRTREKLLADLSPGAAVGSPFERVFGAYCGEFERAAKGNPLNLDGFEFQWSPGECLERALDTVLATAWKGSTALCASDHPQGADIKAAAEDLRGWK